MEIWISIWQLVPVLSRISTCSDVELHQCSTFPAFRQFFWLIINFKIIKYYARNFVLIQSVRINKPYYQEQWVHELHRLCACFRIPALAILNPRFMFRERWTKRNVRTWRRNVLPPKIVKDAKMGSTAAYVCLNQMEVKRKDVRPLIQKSSLIQQGDDQIYMEILLIKYYQ
jgi:hypothetical protein